MTPMQRSIIRATSVALATVAVLYLSAKIAGAEEYITYGAIDGDTIVIAEPCSKHEPENRHIRIYGIDTPETTARFAKCEAEIDLGQKAKAFARTLIKRGDKVQFEFKASDKYGCPRGWVAKITLPDGRDFAETMVKAGHAKPYGLNGNLTKESWCR